MNVCIHCPFSEGHQHHFHTLLFLKLVRHQTQVIWKNNSKQARKAFLRAGLVWQGHVLKQNKNLPKHRQCSLLVFSHVISFIYAWICGEHYHKGKV